MMTGSASLSDVTPRGGSMDARRGSGSIRGTADDDDNSGSGIIGGIPDIAAMIAQQLRDLLPTIVTQIINNANNQGNRNGGGGEDETNGENNKEGHEHGNLRNGGNNNNGNRCLKALTWWNTQVQARGRTSTIGMAWDNFKTLLRDEYCPHNEMQKLENEFWNHTMVGGLTDDIVRNGLLKRSSEKRKESGETGKQEDTRGDNKMTKTRKGFVMTDYGKK
ncbi:hypothetical protein Tco_0783171 [Tanacetum coccineum]